MKTGHGAGKNGVIAMDGTKRNGEAGNLARESKRSRDLLKEAERVLAETAKMVTDRPGPGRRD